MKNSCFLILLFLFILESKIQAQRIELINSGELLEQGIKLHDDHVYDEAIALYKKIGRNDTNYIIALTELAITYTAKEEYETAIKYCEEGLRLNSPFNNQLYMIMGNALDELKKFDEAISVYNKAINEYPYDYMLYFNKGIALRRAEKFSEAFLCFQKAIDINIFHASSHYQLGTLCANNDKFIPAFLSLSLYVLLEPGTQRSRDALLILESMSNMSFEKTGEEAVTADFEDDVFSELDLIVKSKVALSKKYKARVKLDDPFVKQLYLIMENLEINKANKGFWSAHFVPFFKNMFEAGHAEPLSYYMFSGIDNKDIQGWLKKNNPKVEKFIEAAGENLMEIAKNKTILKDGKEIPVSHWYYKSHRLKAIGNTIPGKGDESLNINDWTYYYNTGRIQANTFFDEKGNRTGKWTTYHGTGIVSEISLYENDKITQSKEFFENGKLKYDMFYTDGKLNGTSYGYFPTGQLQLIINLKDGIRHGLSTYFFSNGDKEHDIYYSDGENDSIAIDYYFKGKVKSIVHYKNAKKEGEYIKYAKNGTVIEKGFYKNGLEFGEWKYFFDNGKLKVIKNFNEEGNLDGEVKEYEEDGKPYTEAVYKNGKYEGLFKEYDNGVLYYTIEYSKGKINKYTFYDKQGKEIYTETRKRDKIDFKVFYPLGSIRAEGVYDVDDAKIGEWKYYLQNGQLDAIENYKRGEVHGEYTSYHPNGLVKVKRFYKEDVEDGYYISYFPNGQKEEEGWFKDGKKQGYWKEYYVNGTLSVLNYYLDDELYGLQVDYRVDGSLNYEFYFKDDYINYYLFYDTLGKLIDSCVVPFGTGPVKTLHFNGTPNCIGTYKNGLLEGTVKWYIPSGQAQITAEHYNGRKDGKYLYYFDNGKIYIEGAYSEGKTSGLWKWYFESGKLKTTGSYDENGEATGEWIWYHENGKKDVIKTMKDGLTVGEVLFHDEDGQLQDVKYFTNGYLTGYSYLGPNGKLLPVIPITKETGTVVAYYQNGNKSIEHVLKNGWLDGPSKVYYSNGKIENEKTFKNDEIEGLYMEYYKTGVIKEEKNYLYGMLHGISRFYDKNGKLERIEYYVLDKKHGDWVYFDPAGKIIKTEKWRYGYKL